MPHPTDHLLTALKQKNTSIAVIGLGYVGLPLALCLAKHFTPATSTNKLARYSLRPLHSQMMRAKRDITQVNGKK